MKSHKFDLISFIPGIVITFIGLLFLIPADFGDLVDAIADFDTVAPWFWAGLFTVIGILVIVPALTQGVRNRREKDG